MIPQRTIIAAAVAGVLFCGAARAQDMSYITDDELAEELTSRMDDLRRTTERIGELRDSLAAIRSEMEQIEERIEAIDNRLVRKTSMLYRLSRNGKTVQYLFTSSSAITLLKRIQTLKKIITTEMDAKRQANLELTRAADEATKAEDELAQASELLEELHLAIDDLRHERERREAGNLLAASQ